MNNPGRLYIISAPSGGGKTSLVSNLIESLSSLEVSVSFTTRSPRAGEKEGEDYYFITPSHFQQLIKQKDFLEYAQVFGNYYGTSQKWVEEKLAQGIDVILEIDWQGAQQIRAKLPAVSLFILPPSWKALEARLRKRGLDKEDVIQQRLIEARTEVAHYHDYDYLIVNDNFSKALAELSSILRVPRLKTKIQKITLASLLSTLL